MPPQPVAGVRGAALGAHDALLHEWDVVVLAPHFAAALLARDLSADDVPDHQRVFEFALTYDRPAVVAAARALMARISPLPSGQGVEQGLPATGHR
jgi:DICT domain-containing protein